MNKKTDTNFGNLAICASRPITFRPHLTVSLPFHPIQFSSVVPIELNYIITKPCKNASSLCRIVRADKSVPKFVGKFLKKSRGPTHWLSTNSLAQHLTSQHQTCQHTPSSFAVHLHAPDHLLGAIIRPGHIPLPIKHPVVDPTDI